MPSVVRSTIAIGALALAAASTIMACRENVLVTGLGPDSNVVSVIISPSGVVPMKLGTSLTFTATVNGAATDHRVTWLVTNSHIASVDQTGVLTADSAGTTTIIATARAYPEVSGAVVVVVAAPAPDRRLP